MIRLQWGNYAIDAILHMNVYQSRFSANTDRG
jgi:hypothetical protein